MKTFPGEILHAKIICKCPLDLMQEPKASAPSHSICQHAEERAPSQGQQRAGRPQSKAAQGLWPWEQNSLSLFKFWADDYTTKATDYNKWAHIKRIQSGAWEGISYLYTLVPLTHSSSQILGQHLHASHYFSLSYASRYLIIIPLYLWKNRLREAEEMPMVTDKEGWSQTAQVCQTPAYRSPILGVPRGKTDWQQAHLAGCCQNSSRQELDKGQSGSVTSWALEVGRLWKPTDSRRLFWGLRAHPSICDSRHNQLGIVSKIPWSATVMGQQPSLRGAEARRRLPGLHKRMVLTKD